jgi:Cys-tRNA(Pro) deacylase
MAKVPVTPAIRHLRRDKVDFTPHLYAYEERGGTSVASRELGVPEEKLIKTLIMEDEKGNPVIVLMTGNHEVSTKNLARSIGVKSISPCKPEIAQKHTGYQVGGTSPFGTRKNMPVYMDRTIADQTEIYINGGKRGFLVAFATSELVRVLQPETVEACQ